MVVHLEQLETRHGNVRIILLNAEPAVDLGTTLMVVRKVRSPLSIVSKVSGDAEAVRELTQS